MRKVVIIGILVILMSVSVFPAASGTSKPAGEHTSAHYNLNFSSYNPGTYPSNLSWINFHDINKTQYSTISVENTEYGNGLLVSTNGYSGLPNSYLDMGMKLFNYFTIKITFAWALNNSFSQTGDNIVFQNQSSNILQYKFGSLYNSSLYLSGKTTHLLGKEPPALRRYTLQISGIEQEGALYAGLTSGFNKTSHAPFKLSRHSSNTLYNASFLFGGGFSNLTIYNIYLSNRITGFKTVKRGGYDNYSETNISSVHFSGIDSGSTAKPLMDWPGNSIIYLGQSSPKNIYSYNFYNNSRKLVLEFNSSQSLLSTGSTQYNGYFLIKESGMTSIDVYHYRTGCISRYIYNMNPEAGARIYPSSEALYVQYENGTISVISTGASRVLANVTFQAGDVPLETWVHSGSLDTEIYNNSTGLLSTISVNSSGRLNNISQTELWEVDLHLLFKEEESQMLASYSYTTKIPGIQAFYGMAGGSTSPYVLASNFSVEDAGNSYFLLKGNNGTYLQEKGQLNRTSIRKNAQFIDFNTNLTRGLSIMNKTITLYSDSGDPFSPDNVTLNIHVPNVLRGNISIGYHVNSSVSYNVSAQLGQRRINGSGGYLNFSTAGLNSGNYSFSIKATNIAGYSFTYKKEVSVDNYHPSLSVHPENGSLLLPGTRLMFTASNISGAILVTANGSDNLLLHFSGKDFNITLPQKPGFFNISLRMTDQFGMSYHFSYYFRIKSFNSSGFKTDIEPGAYLPYGSINLTWTGTAIASSYSISITSDSYNATFHAAHNYTDLRLDSGTYRIYINGTNSTGISEPLIDQTFTVQPFDPGVQLKRTPPDYVSFYGDSSNNTLVVNASTNVTTRAWLNYTGPNGKGSFFGGRGNYFTFTINSNSGLFSENGHYRLNFTAMEKSGRSSSRCFIISVNNSIPDLPVNNSTLYYNKSSVRLPVSLASNTSYWYYNSSSPGQRITLETPYILLDNLSTRIVLSAKDLWGNHNHTSFDLVYSKEKPAISLAVSPKQLVFSKNFSVSYRILDPVNLSSVSLKVNNHTLDLGRSPMGNLDYRAREDGTYNFTLEVSDLCGNANYSRAADLKSRYFPEITGIAPHASVFLGIGHFSVGLKGKDLESVNVSWISGGKTVGTGNSFWTFVMPGSHTYDLKIHYHSTTMIKEEHVFTLGYVPEAAVMLTLLGLLLVRKYSGTPDVAKAKDVVRRNLGRSRKDVYRICRKAGIRFVSITEAIAELQKQEEVSIMKDPDGVVYLMSQDLDNT